MEGKIRLDGWRIEDCSLSIDINIIFIEYGVQLN
jgi:hypothetical protein